MVTTLLPDLAPGLQYRFLWSRRGPLSHSPFKRMCTAATLVANDVISRSVFLEMWAPVGEDRHGL